VELATLDGASGPQQRSATALSFDGVFQGACDADMYETVGTPLVEMALAGKAGCLFAYGQTGTGKTYNTWQVVLPRLVASLFIEGAHAVELAAVQLYEDKLEDLLAPMRNSAPAMHAHAHHGAPTSPMRSSAGTSASRSGRPLCAIHGLAGAGAPLSVPSSVCVEPAGMRWRRCRTAAEAVATLALAAERRRTTHRHTDRSSASLGATLKFIAMVYRLS
jgi:hypothetical protein